MSDGIECPEGVEVDITYYFTSDAAGLDVAYALKGCEACPRFDTEAYDPVARAKRFMQTFATDWRPMTRAEVKEYKAKNPEETELDEDER